MLCPSLRLTGLFTTSPPKDGYYLIYTVEGSDDNPGIPSEITKAEITNGPENLSCFFTSQIGVPDISELITANKPLEKKFGPTTGLICYALRDPDAFVPVYLEDLKKKPLVEAVELGERFLDRQLPSWLQITRKAIIMDEPVPGVECRLHAKRLGFQKFSKVSPIYFGYVDADTIGCRKPRQPIMQRLGRLFRSPTN